VLRWLFWVVIGASVLGGVRWYLYDRAVTHPAGALAPAEPTLTVGSSRSAWTDAHDFRYRALGRFAGRVVVVARRNYTVGEFAHLSPTDLAIVWGPLSDPAEYSQLSFGQMGSPLAGRFVFPEIKRDAPLAHRPMAEVRDYLLANLTHLHTIPADRAIASRLADIRPGQVIRFAGTLVEVTSAGGTRYTSSLALHDYDCEVAWIEELALED
jgi:hypothetical protein